MKVKTIGMVTLLAGAVAAPQGAWWLLSDDRHTVSAAQVERAVRQEFEIANDLRLDRLECEPIVRPPGESLCDVQEDDEVFGLIYQLEKDGKSDLFRAATGELGERQAP